METFKIAEKIYEDLNKKGAGLGNVSIGIIQKSIEDMIVNKTVLLPDVIRIPILSNYGGGYRLEYDGKYITLYGKDKNYKCMFGNDYEEMVLIPIVKEIRNAEPEIIEITNTEIVVSLGCV